jgi:hypothetical protein
MAATLYQGPSRRQRDVGDGLPGQSGQPARQIGSHGERGDDPDARLTGAALMIDTTTDAIPAHRGGGRDTEQPPRSRADQFPCGGLRFASNPRYAGSIHAAPGVLANKDASHRTQRLIKKTRSRKRVDKRQALWRQLVSSRSTRDMAKGK